MCLPLLACAVPNFHQQSRKCLNKSSLDGILDFTHKPRYYSFTGNHKLLTVIPVKFQRYLEAPSSEPWNPPAVLHSYMVTPHWEGAAVANNTIPCTGESCSISTALQYSPPVSGIPHTQTHTHTHTYTYTIDNSFKTFKSTLFLNFVHCLY